MAVYLFSDIFLVGTSDRFRRTWECLLLRFSLLQCKYVTQWGSPHRTATSVRLGPEMGPGTGES